MTTSTTATRAISQYAHATKTAADQLRAAEQLPVGLTRLPHLIAAAEYTGRAWGVAELLATTCPARDHAAWDKRRQAALAGCRLANSLIIELVRSEVTA